MATLNIAYAADEAVTIGAWTTTLAADQWASSGLIDNTSNLYVDALVGGFIEMGTGLAAGDTLEVYVSGNYQTATATDMGGGIDALFDANTEEAPGTGFMKENLNLIAVAAVEANEGYHFGPISIAAAFGGVLPQKYFIVLHNNATGALAAGSNVNLVGITYTSA